MDIGSALHLSTTGFLLGWAVAWPPGPVNMEILRRGAVSGFMSGFLICLGAVLGDVIWAIIVFSGADIASFMIDDFPIMAIISITVILILGLNYFISAFKDFFLWKSGEKIAQITELKLDKRGFFFGLSITLTSPWSIAFWIGASAILVGIDSELHNKTILILAIITGALTWGGLLCLATKYLRHMMLKTIWHAYAKTLTSLFLFYIALSQINEFLL